MAEPATPTFSSGVGVTVAGTGTLELAGPVSNLAGAVEYSEQQRSGGRNPRHRRESSRRRDRRHGESHHCRGGDLTAGHIVQNALVIGGSADSPATLTIAPSDAAGNQPPPSPPLTNDAIAAVAASPVGHSFAVVSRDRSASTAALARPLDAPARARRAVLMPSGGHVATLPAPGIAARNDGLTPIVSLSPAPPEPAGHPLGLDRVAALDSLFASSSEFGPRRSGDIQPPYASPAEKLADAIFLDDLLYFG